MKKRIFTLFLVILMLVTNMSVSYASGLGTLTDIGIDNYSETIKWTPNGNGTIEQRNIQTPEEENSSGILKTIMNIIFWPIRMFVNWLINMTAQIVPMLDTVIFNEGIWGNVTRLTFFDSNSSEDDIFENTIAGQMQSTVSAVYQVFRYVALIGFVVAIACIAVKMIISSIGKQKQQYKEQLKNWVIGLTLLVVGHWIMIYLIYLSAWLVELIKELMTSLSEIQSLNNIETEVTLYGVFSECLLDSITGIGLITGIINYVVGLLAIIVFIAMNMKIFKVYLERVIVVAVLIMLFPLVTVLYAFEKAGLRRGSTFSTWLNTFVSQVFIQPIHALALMFIMLILGVGTQIYIIQGEVSLFEIPLVGPIFILMVINFVFKIEEVIKRVFAVSGASMGQPMKPMQEVGKLAKGAINKGIHGYNAGLKMSLANDKKAAFKDIATEALGKWGKKNGLDLDRLGLIESKDIGSKMKSAIKNGKIPPEHIPEIISKFRASGDMHERLSKFGIKNEFEFKELAKNGDLRAMMAVMDLNESGSADKYLKIAKDGNGNFTTDGLDKAQDLFNKSRVPEDQRKRDIRNMANGIISPEGKDALQVNLELENGKRYNDMCSALGKTFDEFDDDEFKAVAYCVEKDINIEDVIMKNSDGSYRGIDVTKVNPMKSDAREIVARQAGEFGVRNTEAERRAARSYAMAEPEYFEQRVLSAGLNMNEVELWMQGNNDNVDGEKLQKLFSLLPNKKKTVAYSNPVETPASVIHLVPDTIGGNMYEANDNVSIEEFANEISKMNSDEYMQASYKDFMFSSTDYDSAEEIVEAYREHIKAHPVYSHADYTNEYYANEGVSIDDFALEISKLKADNPDSVGFYKNFGFRIGDYDSSAEIVDAYSQDHLEQFMLAPELNLGQYDIDRIVTFVDKKDSNFFVDKFRMPADEVMRSLKTNSQAQRMEILKRLQNELKIAQK